MKLLYLIILIILYYIASLYHVTALLLITLALLVLFFLLMIVVHLSRVEISIPDQSVISQDDHTIFIDINNRSPFPINKLIILIRSEDPLQHKQRFRLRVSVKAKERKSVDLDVHSEHLGKIKLYYKKYMIYDLIGLFKRSHALKKEQVIYVLPSSQKMNLTLSENTDQSGEQYNVSGRGQDEDYTLREYRSGDSLKSIHWNMSARFDNLYIREYERQAKPIFLLHIAFSRDQDRDAFYEVFYHLVLTLLDLSQVIIDETSHTIIADPLTISTPNDLDQLMIMLYDCEKKVSGPLSDGYLLNTDCQLYRDGQLIIDFKGGDADAFALSNDPA